MGFVSKAKTKPRALAKRCIRCSTTKDLYYTAPHERGPICGYCFDFECRIGAQMMGDPTHQMGGVPSPNNPHDTIVLHVEEVRARELAHKLLDMAMDIAAHRAASAPNDDRLLFEYNDRIAAIALLTRAIAAFRAHPRAGPLTTHIKPDIGARKFKAEYLREYLDETLET
jgi:hypothetical protein